MRASSAPSAALRPPALPLPLLRKIQEILILSPEDADALEVIVDLVLAKLRRAPHMH